MGRINNSSDDMNLLENRLNLVNKYAYAYAYGGAGEITSEAQARFVNDKMTYVEAFSFVRLCKYLIATSNNRAIQ